MTSEQFAYWLQGYSEIAGDCPTAEQWQVIQDHLATVFDKVTPNRGGYFYDPSTPAIPLTAAVAPPDFGTRTLC